MTGKKDVNTFLEKYVVNVKSYHLKENGESKKLLVLPKMEMYDHREIQRSMGTLYEIFLSWSIETKITFTERQ